MRRVLALMAGLIASPALGFLLARSFCSLLARFL